MISICNDLRKVPNNVSVVEQFRRAAFFDLACANAGFSQGRVASIKAWIRSNPNIDKAIFVAWIQVMEGGGISPDEEGMWLEVANFLAYGGEVEGRPYELSLCEANMIRFYKNHLVSNYSVSSMD